MEREGGSKIKVCTKCGVAKPLSEFHKDGNRPDGHRYECKNCSNEHHRKYLKTHSGKQVHTKGNKKYRTTPAGKQARARGSKIYDSKYPQKKIAVATLNNAVRDGRITRLPCFVCGTTVWVHGHHEDYNEPLVVVWLCPKHHDAVHKLKREVLNGVS